MFPEFAQAAFELVSVEWAMSATGIDPGILARLDLLGSARKDVSATGDAAVKPKRRVFGKAAVYEVKRGTKRGTLAARFGLHWGTRL